MKLWAHQQRAVDEIDAAIGRGRRRIVVTIPTGGGKTLVMRTLAEHWLADRRKVSLYTNRTMLREQISDALMDAGIYHGVRAAGEADEREHHFQISSIQTEYQRVIKRGQWDLHEADLVLVDEAHLQKEAMAQAILRRHAEAGALIVGMTATPLGLSGVYEHLIVGATNSDLLRCGANVVARHFAPDEPDMRAFKKLSSEKQDLKVSDKDVRSAMGPRPQLFGRVWANFQALNPDCLPTILFALGVEESVWFAQQFTARGVRAAHLDGDDVWLDNEFLRSDRDVRQRIVRESQSGALKVICNRFVMREGIDLPWLRHGIFATVFGSVQSYLQAGGRLLRSHPGKEFVTVQDHGGNYWRFGPLNEDREWFLEQTAEMAYGLRADRIRKGEKDQPFRCPKCGRTWSRGRVCKPAHGGCGYELPAGKKLPRPVVTADGSLREATGSFFRPRQMNRSKDAVKDWCDLILFRCREGTKGERTFRQATAAYAMDHGWQWPDPAWPLTPIDERDWWLPVHLVPPEGLRGNDELLDNLRHLRARRERVT